MNMKTADKRLLRLIAALLLCVMALSALTLPVGAVFPKPIDSIADQAAKLSESTIRQIKKTNETLLDKVGCTIAVCTVLTTGDTAIRDYAHDLFLDWKLGEGVLLLIAAEDNDYFLVQSTGVDEVLNNERLESIRDEYLEENFVAGNIDRGVLQCVMKISQILLADMKNAEKTAADSTDNAADPAPTEEKSTIGSAIVGFFKTILIIILVVAALFIAFFIYAMFNDDAAAILQKFVFQRGNQQKMPESYYDERQYHNANQPNAAKRSPQNHSQNPQTRPANRPAGQNGQPAQNGQVRTQQNRQAPVGYLQNGQYAPNIGNRQLRPAAQNGQNGQNGSIRQTARPNPNPYAQPRQQQNPNANYADSSETRAYTIPGRGQNR